MNCVYDFPKFLYLMYDWLEKMEGNVIDKTLRHISHNNDLANTT